MAGPRRRRGSGGGRRQGRARRGDVLDRYGYGDRREQGARGTGGAGVGTVDRARRPAVERRERPRAEPQAARAGCGGRGGTGVPRHHRAGPGRDGEHRAARRDRDG